MPPKEDIKEVLPLNPILMANSGTNRSCVANTDGGAHTRGCMLNNLMVYGGFINGSLKV